MLRTLLRDEYNRFRVVDDPSCISDLVENKDRLLWLDLESPTHEELATIQEEFGLHPLAIEDAVARHQRPKVEQYDNFYLVVFYSVGVEKPGEHALQGRRGLRGTAFHRPLSEDNEAGELEEDPEQAGAPAEGELIPPPADDSEERIVLRELTLFLGRNYLITVHDHPVTELDEAARRWRRNSEIILVDPTSMADLPGTRTLSNQERVQLRRPDAPPGDAVVAIDPVIPSPTPGTRGIGILLYSLLDSIVDKYFPVIDSVVERVEDLEEQIFERFNQKAIESIFTLKKDLLALRKVLAPERDVLNVLIRRDLPLFDEHTIIYFQDVYDHVVRITDSIDTYRDLLSSALDSFLSMQSNRLNVTVQTLTSVSIILMSVAAITGWYGMNFAAMPELTSAFGYPGVMLLVGAVVALELLFFKRKGWL